jgi:hypothetical protein
MDVALEDTGFDLSLDDFPEKTEELKDLEEASLEETSLEDTSMDLSDAIIDEPDLSADITEAPLEEPSLGDIALDVGDFDLGSDFDEKDEVPATEDVAEDVVADASLADNPDEEIIDFALDDFGDSVEMELDAAKDDGLAQIIPEGFEVNVEEAAVSVDDDLAFADDELSVGREEVESEEPIAEAEEDAAAEEINIPEGLKIELKSVLSYMDHLLESLPEEKIEEFAKSEYFDAYKKLFKDLGLAES